MFTFENTRDCLTATNRAAGEWWIRTGLIAVDAEDWPTAFDRLSKLADFESELTASAWSELVEALLFACVKGKLHSRVDSVIARMGPKAWPDGNLSAATDVLRRITFVPESQVALQAAKSLQRHFPNAARAQYAAAIVYEAREEPVKAADGYAAAASLTKSSSMAQHSWFRAACTLLRNRRQTGRGRELIKKVDRSLLPAEELLLYAAAMFHSSFFLDRRRALDVLEDVVQLVSQNRPDAVQYSTTQLKAVIRECVANLPQDATDDEFDRLIELIDSNNFDGPAKASLRGRVDGLRQLSQHTDTSIEGDSQFPAALGEEVLTRIQAWNGVAVNTPDEIATALVRLQRGRLEDAAIQRCIRPVQPASILVLLKASEVFDKDERTVLTPHWLEWVQSAPAPSFGFWTLAAHLQSLKLSEAGAAVAKRAIEDGESEDPKLVEAVQTKALNWALRKGPRADLRFWLETLAHESG